MSKVVTVVSHLDGERVQTLNCATFLIAHKSVNVQQLEQLFEAEPTYDNEG